MDYENVYMVEFKSGRVIHVGQFTVQDVIEYCADKYKDEVIETIYKEVYTATEIDEEESA